MDPQYDNKRVLQNSKLLENNPDEIRGAIEIEPSINKT